LADKPGGGLVSAQQHDLPHPRCRSAARLPCPPATALVAHLAEDGAERHRAASCRLVDHLHLAAAVAGDAQEPRRERPHRLPQRLGGRRQRVVTVAAPVALAHRPAGHQVAPGSQPAGRARMPRTMSAKTSTPKATVTQSIGRSPAEGVLASRLARASCETRRNASLTGSGGPSPFAMPQIIAAFVRVPKEPQEFPREDEMFGVRSALWRIWTIALASLAAAAALSAALISLAAI
jgi:hypothetical protein